MENKTVLSAARKRYLKSIRRHERFIISMQIVLLVAIVVIWELAAFLGWIDPFITSSPSRVAETFIRLFRDGELFLHIGITLFETVLGFLIGTGLGILIAAILWWSPTLCRILDPYLVILNALPKIALGPILIVWVGAGVGSIVVMAVLVSLIVTTVTVLTGFMDITGEKQLLMKTLGATTYQIFSMVVFPATIPTMIAALKISVGMSWVGVIVGEYLVSQAGLGYLIVYGGQVFQLDLVMTSIVVLCFLAGIMYYGVSYVERRISK